MSYSIRVLLIGVLLLASCPKPAPGPEPVHGPRPDRRAATTPRAAPKATLQALLKELAQSKAGAEIALRKVVSRYLPAAQAAAMVEKCSVTVLRVGDDDGKLMGAFLELRPSPLKRCVLKDAEAAQVYWFAEQEGPGGQTTLVSTPVKTQMFWGKKPKPEVTLPMKSLGVPVFKVKVNLEGDNRCQHVQMQYYSLEVTEVYTAVKGHLRQIVKHRSQEQPVEAGAHLDNSVKTRWVESGSKVLYLAVIRVAKRSVPEQSDQALGAANAMMHYCSRKVTVYEITAAGTAGKLSAASLKARRKTTPALAALPHDLTSKKKDACDKGF